MRKTKICFLASSLAAFFPRVAETPELIREDCYPDG